MKVYDHRSRLGLLVDAVTFPVRALLVHEQSGWGLSSLRDERMRTVARYCTGRVLDIGCGPNNRFVRQFYRNPESIGIDCHPYNGVDKLVDDMARLPFPDASFDTVTLIAVGGHIPRSKRVPEFREFSRVLKVGGRLLMTEGEPITQFLHHKWKYLYYGMQGEQDMDTERGMHEDEEYAMPRKEILTYLNTPPLLLVNHVRFMWGLNNLYFAKKSHP